VPQGSQVGTFVVSLDFELHWGVRDRYSVEDYERNLLGAREAIPRMLERFAAHDVHATWATVGMLFCESKEELLERLPERRPAYSNSRLSPYDDVLAVGADERADPVHFAPSLIRQIAATPGQEVATHTFSHYYCLEPGQALEHFEADLDAAVEVARAARVELRSIVFPRNQVNVAYLPACRERGLIAFRGTQHTWMHRPRSDFDETRVRRAARLLDAYAPISPPHARPPQDSRPAGLVDVPASRFLRPRSRALAALEGRKVGRVVGELERAARDGAVYHLWWHPHNFGVDRDRHLAQLDAVLDRFSRLRAEGRMRSLTMAELAREQGA
jgi:peptidoglycan/xylan/chitin deacetylase (PgdA/CDA1 family)